MGSQPVATALSQKLRGQDPYPTVYELLDVSSAVFSDAVTVFER
jgi:hypothetical protein